MHSFRDILVCGPVLLATALFRDAAGMGPVLAIGVGFYVGLRLLAEVTGLEQAVRDRHNVKIALGKAERAERAASTP